jgi:hypothetical protein
VAIRWLKQAFRLLASLKVAIPLLVLLIVVTVVASLFPEPDWFRSPWYLALLGLQGLSLLFITILHIPSILRRKGRNALLGVITTHLGILVLIAGVIYGGFTGFRHNVKLVEGEVTVIPGLPFAIQLDELRVEEYRQEEFPRLPLETLPKKQQDSYITLLQNGKAIFDTVTAPGKPVRFDGTTMLPSISDIGWYFELIVTDQLGRDKTVPVRPWALPVLRIGEREFITHGATQGDLQEAELFAIVDEQPVSVGFVRRDQALEVDDHKVRLGAVKRYTAMQVYNRPQEPILVWGSVLMFAGLVWHFYFRHRDRRREGKSDA